MENTVTIEEIEYRIGKLNAFKEFHITRRLAPLAPKLYSAFKNGVVRDISGLGEERDPAVMHASITKILESSGPFLETLAHMTDEESEYVIRTCLGAVRRKQGTNSWAPLTTDSGQVLFDDLSFTAMLQLTYHVAKEVLAKGFRSMPLSSAAETA